MPYSIERRITVTTTPRKVLGYNKNRYSWDITNISAQTVYYQRGVRGRDIATTGEAQGIPIDPNAVDGMDEEDAVDEVWVIAPATVDIMLSETLLP